MVNLVGLEDPLQGYSGLSLFHRTFGSLAKRPNHPDLHHDDLLSSHNFLKSMPVKNSDKLIEQTKGILDATSEPATADSPDDIMAEDKIEAVVVQKNEESLHARRPGLGRKRARFSLIPNSSQPTVNLEPTLDFDNLKDPEQFFLAFERLEDAKKEMAKQTGRVSVGSSQSSTSMAPRPRRPGMSGRSRTVKYQHLYPTMASQETFMPDILSPSNPGSQQETVSQDVVTQLRESANVASEESELAASMVKAEKNVDKLLEDLLARDYEELDGDGAVTLLQDHLQVKSLDIEKLNLPELLYARRISLDALGGNFSKPRNVLSDIRNLPRRTTTPMKQQVAGNSAPSSGSPTPLKSPLASIALLRKRIPQSNQFSVFDIDQLPEINTSSFEKINCPSDPVNTENDLSMLKCQIIEEDDTTAGNISPTEVAIGDSGTSVNKSMNDYLASLGSDSDVCHRKSSAEVENSNTGVDNEVIDENSSHLGADADVKTIRPNELEDMVEDIQKKAVDKSLNDNLSILGSGSDVYPSKSSAEVKNSNVGVDNGGIDENLSQLGGDADIQTNGPTELDDMVEDIQKKAVDKSLNDDLSILGSGNDVYPSKSSAEVKNSKVGVDNGVIDENLCQPGGDADIQKNGPNELDDMVEDIQQKAVGSAQPDDTTMEFLNTLDQFEQSSPAFVEDHAMDSFLETEGIGLENTNDNASERHDERVEKPLEVSTNKQTKAKSRTAKRCRNGSLSRRQSLAASGTSWETGVRQSTRIRSSPLEYWRGEKILYGRIHGKQSSPAFVEDHAMDSCLETKDGGLENTNDNTSERYDERVEKPLEVSTNKQTKTKSRTAKRRRNGSLSRRQSLAASGTLWETGVRRSTRIRSRPLEYWRGERFLYGRIHGTLATVIGIKYDSPGNDKGKPLKVKSFVSDEYKDLVELAALH